MRAHFLVLFCFVLFHTVSTQEQPQYSFGVFTVHHANKGCIRLQNGGSTLVLDGADGQRAQMAEDNPKGPRAMFYVEEVGQQGSAVYSLCNQKHRSFAASVKGRLSGHRSNSSIAQFTFRIDEAPVPAGISPLGGVQRLDWDESYLMTVEQKKHFVEHGFIKLDQCVSREQVSAALKAINAALCLPDAIGTNPAGGTQYCASVGTSDAILDLMYASPGELSVYRTQ